MGEGPSSAPMLASVFGIPRAQAKEYLKILDDTKDLGPQPFPLPVHAAPIAKIAASTVTAENNMLRRAGILVDDDDETAKKKVLIFLESVRPNVITSTLATYTESSQNALHNRGENGPWSEQRLRVTAKAIKRQVPTPMPPILPKLDLVWSDFNMKIKMCMTVFRYAPVALRWGDLDGIRPMHIFRTLPPLPPGIGLRVARQKVPGRITDVRVPAGDPMAEIIWTHRHDNGSRPFRVPDGQKVAGHNIKRYQVVWGLDGNHAGTCWMHYRFGFELDPDSCDGQAQPGASPLHQLLPTPALAPDSPSVSPRNSPPAAESPCLNPCISPHQTTAKSPSASPRDSPCPPPGPVAQLPPLTRSVSPASVLTLTPPASPKACPAGAALQA